MDRFNALQMPQKIAVIVGSMALFAGLFYYSMIIEMEDQRVKNEIQKKEMSLQIKELKETVGESKLAPLTEKNKSLEKRKKSFAKEKELPREMDLERFVTGISQTARNSGLKLQSFKKKRPAENHYYQEVPIEMEVKGTFREFIGFLRAIAKEGSRIVNIRDLELKVEELPIAQIVTKYETRRNEELPGGAKRRDLDPAAKQMQLVRAYEEAIANGVQLNAKFVAFVFSYTGKPAGKEAAKEVESQKNLKILKRKELSTL
jgi:type IV pilus assembly protein PilO